MDILGINATFHDSSACLVRDGRVIAAVEEERFTRIKHHKRATPFLAHALPFHAIDYCLAAGGITLDQVDHVAYGFDPFLLVDASSHLPRLELPRDVDEARQGPRYDPWETIFLAGVTAAPRMLVDDAPWHLRRRIAGERSRHGWQFHFVPHHLAHAASAFLPSPFERAAVLTLDGRGECLSTLLGVGHETAIESLREVGLPHSLGLLYERVTEHLGFRRSSDEYKVMALAAYGQPRYAETLRGLLRWRDDGTYEVLTPPLDEVLGPPRPPGRPLEPRHADVAASLQTVLEEAALRLAAWLHEQTGEENLCLAGGVALNCVMNSRLARESPFRRVWVQPAANDAGTALGAALWVWARQVGGERWRMDDALLGPSFSDESIAEALEQARVAYYRPHDIARAVADLLARGEVVAWFQGRMEFGPRALGARSLLGSPAEPAMVQRLNALKDREDFRPVAPAVLEEAAADYFEDCSVSPFMLFVYQVRPDKAHLVPAICHVDGTARVQTVSRARSPLFHRLIEAFRQRTGLPLVINTSFNTRSQPIVCTPQDALACFFTSPIDALAIGSFLVHK